MKRFGVLVGALVLVSGLCARSSATEDENRAYQTLPRCTSVDPETAKTGDIVTAKGENLSTGNIAELYLTDGQNDIKVAISDQSDTEIKFKVPQIKAGRFHLLFLTANRASLIEQPVVLTVE